MTHRTDNRSTGKKVQRPALRLGHWPLRHPNRRLPTCIRSCPGKAPPPYVIHPNSRAFAFAAAIHSHRCLCNALLLVEENWGACSTRHESPSRLLRRFRRREPPRKGACELPNYRTSLLFLTALQEFETRLLLCRPKRKIELEPNRPGEPRWPPREHFILKPQGASGGS